ncbi:MAG: BlaI/MecI/CopY family transcriptional regulator [Pseudomonadales bacterium]|nr:BlaI/MecI/CopY family transcriptional regulator [Pseudomonadales bacterium]
MTVGFVAVFFPLSLPNKGKTMQLGELEKLLLEYLWQVQVADAKQVHRHFEPIRGGSLNTIQSTLDRLFKKGLLHRSKSGYAFYYSPAVERRELIGSLIQSLTAEFARQDANAVLEAFVDISATLDEESLQRLEKMIAEKKALEQGGGS